MQFVELKNALKNKVEPIYMLYGTDIFLINKSIELIANALITQEVTKFDETATASRIKMACQTVSLFGGKRMVIVRGVGDAVLKELAGYISRPNTDCALVLVYNAEKITAKNTQTVDCNPMAEAVIVKLIVNQLASQGKQITGQGAMMLSLYCGNNYARIDGEINKLVNFYKDIQILDKQHIEETVTKTEEFQIYELGNAVTKKDLVLSEKILGRLLTAGVEEYAIFGSLVSHIRRLYYSLLTSCQPENVAAILKCSPWAVVYARRDHKYLVPDIGKLYKKALDLEYAIKSGGVSITSAIEILRMAV